ncbi:hypothetical protein M427DRAFT_451704 [Gonapodya prolifera JEL478]|uniref:SLA1 homology domain-containing protein n=1 Tax=Gonapodya prolifera (strain JEL478) TaxID=1344416 RepID=A0A139ARW4_GONPJ|nr:hypothetical protein M427DRAFT_451704 [Gonapodya prolifera JEL478]|eukprot:KXS19488.1 hypothetical protein M427DRAFT_451704 [Gonapodya prolifera JEL478]
MAASSGTESAGGASDGSIVRSGPLNVVPSDGPPVTRAGSAGGVAEQGAPQRAHQANENTEEGSEAPKETSAEGRGKVAHLKSMWESASTHAVAGLNGSAGPSVLSSTTTPSAHEEGAVGACFIPPEAAGPPGVVTATPSDRSIGAQGTGWDSPLTSPTDLQPGSFGASPSSLSVGYGTVTLPSAPPPTLFRPAATSGSVQWSSGVNGTSQTYPSGPTVTRFGTPLWNGHVSRGEFGGVPVVYVFARNTPFEVPASYLDVREDAVRGGKVAKLRRVDGMTIEVDVRDLSAVDVAYIEAVQELTRGTAPNVLSMWTDPTRIKFKASLLGAFNGVAFLREVRDPILVDFPVEISRMTRPDQDYVDRWIRDARARGDARAVDAPLNHSYWDPTPPVQARGKIHPLLCEDHHRR